MKQYFFVSPLKELDDIYSLFDILKKDKWIIEGEVPTIVICSPEYSSIMSQILLHKLSFLNKHVPFNCDFLVMPYPDGGSELTDEEYIEIINDFALRYESTGKKLLFLNSAVLSDSNFTTLKNNLLRYLDSNCIRFGCLYKQSDSIFEPDYCVETFDLESQGGLMFWWEDINNPHRE